MRHIKDFLSGNTNSQGDEMTRAEKVAAVAEYLSRGKPEEWPRMLVSVLTDRYPPDVIAEGKARALASVKAQN